MTTPLERSDRRAHCWLKVRKLSPMRVPPAQSLTVSATRASARSRSLSRSSRVTRVSRVPNTNDSARTSRRGREGLDEAQQQPRVALHRARDVAQHDERAGLLHRPPPDPRQELAARAEVPPEHRPRREPPTVRVELVATRPPLLEARDQRVDQPLGVTQLGRGHPVELAVAQHLAARVRVGRDDHALDVGVLLGIVVAGRGDRHALLVRIRLDAILAGRRLGLAGGLALEALVVARPTGAAVPRNRPGAGGAGATIDRRPRRRSRGRRAAARRRPRRPRGPARAQPMSTIGRARA